LKSIYSRVVLVVVDFLIIALSIIIGYYLRVAFSDFFEKELIHPLSVYLFFPLIYIVIFTVFTYEGVYTKRFDFWHESKQIIKSLFISFIIILAYLAITKTIDDYSRAVFIFAFLVMLFLLPLFKLIVKNFLYKIGLWRKGIKIYSDDKFLKDAILSDSYLGYYEDNKNAQTVFINSKKHTVAAIRNIINKELKEYSEVNFIPLLNEYDLTHSNIYFLFKSKTNLIVFKNRLKSKLRILVKDVSDIVLSIVVIPFILPIMAFIAYKIKKEEPSSPIFFKQERLGKNAKPFMCYKFRTMYEDGDKLLNEYLKKHPEEIEHYKKYKKYKNDPRVTKIGKILRKTSLDELPQIINVLKREMSLIGPRPYLPIEKEEMGEDYIEVIFMVKPGITGLWQVSGRSDTDYEFRIKTDKWYVINWSLWLDIVILFKTIKVVLKREGAY